MLALVPISLIVIGLTTLYFFNEQNIDIFAEEVENRIDVSCFENGLIREDKILNYILQEHHFS